MGGKPLDGRPPRRSSSLIPGDAFGAASKASPLLLDLLQQRFGAYRRGRARRRLDYRLEEASFATSRARPRRSLSGDTFFRPEQAVLREGLARQERAYRLVLPAAQRLSA